MARNRKIIVYIATSADGFIARRDGSVDWLDRPNPKGNYGMKEFYQSIDTILWGRKTCDVALDFQKKGVTGSDFRHKSEKLCLYARSRALASTYGCGVRERIRSKPSQPVCGRETERTSG